MKPMTSKWVRAAEADYHAACFLRRSREQTCFDAIFFHCQMCIEQYLKARLSEAAVKYSNARSLYDLLELIRRIEPRWARVEMPFLRHGPAIEVLYPGSSINRRDVSRGMQTCERMRALARSRLGLKA